MIFSIDKLSNLGIYNTIPPKCASDFKRYNLIYGWNGSGKSTLSRFFSFVGGHEIPKEFNGLKFTITVDGLQYTEKQMPLLNENIAVFNEDFVQENIDWNGTLKSILLLDEKNIETTKNYNTLKNELFGSEDNLGLIKKLENKRNEVSKADNELQKILTAIGKTVKNNYQLLDTNDSYYLNYDKRKVLSLLDDFNYPLSDIDLLQKDELEKAIQKAKPLKKDKICVDLKKVSVTELEILIKNTYEIVSRKISAKVINELRDNQEMADWVEKGMMLHKRNKRTSCAFCGGIISDERYNDLDAHFSDALNRLNSDIEKSSIGWENFKLDEQCPCFNTTLYYDELTDSIRKYSEEYESNMNIFNKEIDKYIHLLSEKKSKPFDHIDCEVVQDIIVKCCENINCIFEKCKEMISEHNKKTDNFEESTKAIKKKVERHYVREQVKGLAYDKKLRNLNKIKKELENEKVECDNKIAEYNELEKVLSNETLGAEEFNKKLEKFLGYNEIELRFDTIEKGYKIYRNKKEEATNLSEGEKTAIAFIYFITKLKENGKKIDDSTLVIDDPISSFDSNKLFSSYAYMKSECENAKQIFVLTHNYNFFSLVLGWFNKKHVKDISTGKKMPAYSIYRVENHMDQGKRMAILNNGGESLKQATEYDYVFYSVYSMKDKILTKQESIFCGNVCRKLIESFLSFKFPKQRADLAALLLAALPKKEDDIVRERIYKFVNIYSHEKKIDVFEELDTDILDTNNHTVINDILDLIKGLDENHYNAMVEKVQNEIFEVEEK